MYHETRGPSSLQLQDGNGLISDTSLPAVLRATPSDLQGVPTEKSFSNVYLDTQPSSGLAIPVVTITPPFEDNQKISESTSSNTPEVEIKDYCSQSQLALASSEIKRFWSDYDEEEKDIDLSHDTRRLAALPKLPTANTTCYADLLRSNESKHQSKQALSTEDSSQVQECKQNIKERLSTILEADEADDTPDLVEQVVPLAVHGRRSVALLKASINYSKMPKPLLCLPPAELSYWQHTAVHARAMYAAATGEDDKFNEGYKQMLSDAGVVEGEGLIQIPLQSSTSEDHVDELYLPVTHDGHEPEVLEMTEDIAGQEDPNNALSNILELFEHSGDVSTPDLPLNTTSTTIHEPVRVSPEDDL